MEFKEQLSEVAQRELRWMSRFSKDLYKDLLREGKLQEYMENLDKRLDKLEKIAQDNLEEHLHKEVQAGKIDYLEMIAILQSEALTRRAILAEQIRPPLDEEAQDKI